MIRRASDLDKHTLLSLGMLFAVESQPVHTFVPTEARILQFIETSLANPDCVFLVYELDGVVRGFIVGFVTQIYFSEERVLQEMAFFSSAKGGFKLLDAFEEEAKRRGVNKIVVGSKPDFCDLWALYTKRGYRVLEEQFIKVGV